MVLPGISGKIYPGRMTQVILEDDPRGSRVSDKTDPKCATEKEILAAYKGFKLPQK